MRKVLVTAGLFALALAPVAVNAQSINVDFQGAAGNSGTPAATYGAAGSVGFWNVISSTASTPVNGLNGMPAGVNVQSSTAAGFNFDNAGTLGNDQALLDDLFDLGGAGATGSLSITGLDPGNYSVITYAWAPDDPGFLTSVAVPGAVQGPQIIGGNFGGAPALGITHALHNVTVGGTGQISINAATSAGFGSLNGLQLVIPEPATLSLLGLGSLALIRRRR